MDDITKDNNYTGGSSMDDVVFADRNKSYGAYKLRKKYAETFAMAMFFSATVLTASLFLYSFILKKGNKEEVVEVIQDVVIEDVVLDEKQPEQPKVEPPPPVVEEIQFVPPIVKENVVEEVIPPSQEDLEEKKNIGTENVKGDTIESIHENTEVKKLVGDEEDDTPHAIVEENAEFPGGGRSAMMKFVAKNLVYPESAKRKELEGTVVVYFEIDKTGKIVNAKVMKGFNKECDEEALRVIKMFPDWKPAKMNGRVVRQRTNLPIKFTMPID